MNEQYLFPAFLALTVAIAGVIIVQVVFELLEVKKRRLQERLGNANAAEAYASAYAPIAFQEKTDDVPPLLARFSLVRRFNALLQTAMPDLSLSRFALLATVIAIAAFVMAYLIFASFLAAFVAAVAAAIVPFVVVRSKFYRRQRIMDDQLPEALEFLARILRAGHSLATGLQMGGDELPEPLASEFRKCHDQHSLGQALDVVIKDMAIRVGTPDFAFFVTAVLIQRQTGGDLAEVLGNISNMVRQRIRLGQHVKAITAEGRLVGGILLVLPIVVFFIIYGLNPNYAGLLLTTTDGYYLCFAAISLQILGLFTIRKIVSVKL